VNSGVVEVGSEQEGEGKGSQEVVEPWVMHTLNRPH
jgi:hypothetical protein